MTVRPTILLREEVRGWYIWSLLSWTLDFSGCSRIARAREHPASHDFDGPTKVNGQGAFVPSASRARATATIISKRLTTPTTVPPQTTGS